MHIEKVYMLTYFLKIFEFSRDTRSILTYLGQYLDLCLRMT